MNNREIEKNLYKAIENSAPDNLETIREDCRNTFVKSPLPQERRRFTLLKPALSLMAALILFVGGLTIHNQRLNGAVTTVNLDVNPSIELQMNRDNKVLQAIANNEEGKQILADMDFRGSDIKVAINAVVGSMVRNGYLSELTNSILVSVQNKDQKTAGELQQLLTSEINSILQTESFTGAVLSQTVSGNDDTVKIAEEYGISLGKAQLIQEICDKTMYTPADLASLNINDLNLILHHVNTNTVNSTGTPSEKQYIGEDRALQIALEDLGVTNRSQLTDVEIEFEYENKTAVYEVEFDLNGYEYEYTLEAASGKITAKSIYEAGKPRTIVPDHATFIGKDAAKQIALQHAGVKEKDVKNYECELDRDGSDVVYDIEFEVSGTEYDYEIDAASGKILKSEKEQDGNKTSPVPSPATNYIGKEKARQTALKHAGVKEKDVRDLEVTLDKEKGIVVYEVEFKANGYEYEYEIEALSGKIISCEKEKDDDSPKGNSTPSSSYISAERAKQLALDHAGLKEAKATAKLDDGVWEVEFKANGYEYEYEIDAKTGKILHHEKEIDD